VARQRVNFRDSQFQARIGLISSIAAAVFVLLLAVFVLQNFDPTEKTIIFSRQSARYPAILGATGLSAFFSTIGFGLGISSLGHKRNSRQRESWAGFLVGAMMICLAIILFVMFQLFKLPIIA
jgi:uncharacterized integral membrane protein